MTRIVTLTRLNKGLDNSCRLQEVREKAGQQKHHQKGSPYLEQDQETDGGDNVMVSLQISLPAPANFGSSHELPHPTATRQRAHSSMGMFHANGGEVRSWKVLGLLARGLLHHGLLQRARALRSRDADREEDHPTTSPT